MNTYIHKTNQRLRVRSDFIRQNPNSVNELIADLEQIDAIGMIKHKRFAGSVAINFDDKELDCDSLLEILEGHAGCVGMINPHLSKMPYRKEQRLSQKEWLLWL